MNPEVDASTALPRVLIVDDEPTIRLILKRFLDQNGYESASADCRKQAEELLRAGRFDAAILDYQLPDGNALEILAWLKSTDTDVPVILLSGVGTIDIAVQAIQQGAEHFLTKPIDLHAFEVILERLLENKRHQRQHQIQRQHRARQGLDPFCGTSAAIRRLADVAAKIATSASPVLIQGETGVGKGVLARWLHENGPRGEEAFVDINCASLSPEFLDSELFGHHRGAFTGAVANKSGLLEVGHRGTLFLDEIGDVDLAVQPKLLKVLEEKRFRRMGEVRERIVDIRLIAASHRDLRQLAGEHRFRQDLFFRISSLPLEIPPLRARREDVRPLAESILPRLAAELGRGDVALSPGAVAAMERYAWPGNLRELRNVLERALLLSSGDALGADDLCFEVDTGAVAGMAEEDLTLLDVERRHIEHVLAEVDRAIAPAARVLGISRSTLYQKIKAHGIELARL